MTAAGGQGTGAGGSPSTHGGAGGGTSSGGTAGAGGGEVTGGSGGSGGVQPLVLCELATGTDSCDECQATECRLECDECESDPQCLALVECVNTCPPRQEGGAYFDCVEVCGEGIPPASGAEFGDVVTCRKFSCVGRCPDPTVSNGGAGGTGTGGSGAGGTAAGGTGNAERVCVWTSHDDDCDACVDDKCQSECVACVGNAACLAGQECANECPFPEGYVGCVTECSDGMSAGDKALGEAILNCHESKCSDVCPSLADGGTTP